MIVVPSVVVVPAGPLGPAGPGGVRRVSAASTPSASAFVAIEPARLADTRIDAPATDGAVGFVRVSTDSIRVQVAGRLGVPEQATAAVLSIVAVEAAGPGVITAFPSGTTMPVASTVNLDARGRTIGNLATVQLGIGGAIDIVATVEVGLVIDVSGAYVPVDGPVRAGRLEMLESGARRLLDTRTDEPFRQGTHRTMSLSPLGAPPDAVAAVLSVVAVDANVGFWTLAPTRRPLPVASSLNVDAPRQTRSGQVIVALAGGVDGPSFDVFSQSGGDLVIDVAGWFTGTSSSASTDGLFVPAPPMRMLDTRYLSGIAPWGGSTVELDIGSPFPSATSAVAMNITAVDPLWPGFVTAYPAGGERPGSSTLNVTALDQVVANHSITRVGTRGVALYTQSGTQLVVDVTGWYLGAPASGTRPPPANPSSAATTATGVFGPGVAVSVGYGPDLDAVIDSGRAGLWDGVGLLGVRRSNVFFAHRTSHGAPFRSLDRFVPGTMFVVQGDDGRGYRYLVTRQDVIVPKVDGLQSIVAVSGPVTATLVACHPPGSVRYRIVITGRLVGLVP